MIAAATSLPQSSSAQHQPAVPPLSPSVRMANIVAVCVSRVFAPSSVGQQLLVARETKSGNPDALCRMILARTAPVNLHHLVDLSIVSMQGGWVTEAAITQAERFVRVLLTQGSEPKLGV